MRNEQVTSVYVEMVDNGFIVHINDSRRVFETLQSLFDWMGESMQVHEEKLDYEEWLEVHYDNLLIEFAESGADRELDFNPENEFEKRYQKYLTK